MAAGKARVSPPGCGRQCPGRPAGPRLPRLSLGAKPVLHGHPQNWFRPPGRWTLRGLTRPDPWPPDRQLWRPSPAPLPLSSGAGDSPGRPGWRSEGRMEIPWGPARAPGWESPSSASERVTDPESEPAAAATSEGRRSSGHRLHAVTRPTAPPAPRLAPVGTAPRWGQLLAVPSWPLRWQQRRARLKQAPPGPRPWPGCRARPLPRCRCDMHRHLVGGWKGCACTGWASSDPVLGPALAKGPTASFSPSLGTRGGQGPGLTQSWGRPQERVLREGSFEGPVVLGSRDALALGRSGFWRESLA